MHEPVPRWRYWLVPPEWLRMILAFGPIESVRIWRNPDHPIWRRRRINDCLDARAAYARWWESLKQSQRRRFLFGLPQGKWRPSAHIIRPPQFHPEIARAVREREAIEAWSRQHPDRDPIECPIYQERIARLRERLDDPLSDNSPQ